MRSTMHIVHYNDKNIIQSGLQYVKIGSTWSNIPCKEMSFYALH